MKTGIILAIVRLLRELPSLRPAAAVIVGMGLLVAGGLILKRRRSQDAPSAARLNSPLDLR
jgi:LPXTG-motif cell wall-anchored protein